ncbi:MAG: hypothetical protein HY286_02960 [Planctomycetes bacterium]|nr:hypothetical protein [Planctomycetota bacterium]
MSKNLESPAPAPQRLRLEAWTWPKAFLAVLAICFFAWGLGTGLRAWASNEWHLTTSTIVFVVSGSLAAVSFLVLSWRAVFEFFLSIRVGVAILVFFLLGSILSVLIPPRDPNAHRYDENGRRLSADEQETKFKDDFAWATGYFLYHVTHLYGIGMPATKLPFEEENSADSPLEPTSRPKMSNPLERVGRHYGERVAKQEESGMRTAFNGRARGIEIQKFIFENRGFFDGFYEFSRKSQLSGTDTAKGAWASDWFSTLTGLLFLIVLTNTFRRGIARSIAQGSPGFGFISKLPAALLWDLKSLLTPRDRIGFLVTHLGVMTAITGGFWLRLTEERGVVRLSLYPPMSPNEEFIPRESSSFQTYDYRRLFFGTPERPFAVRLDKFHADYRDNIEVKFIQDPPSRSMASYSHFEIWKGRQMPFEYDDQGRGEPKTVVRVLEHWPRASIGFDLAERTEGEDPSNDFERQGPALKVRYEYQNNQFEGFLVANGDFQSVFDKVPGARIRYESAINAAEQDAKLAMPFEGDALGTIHIFTQASPLKPAATVPIAKNGTFKFKTSKGDASVKILNALPDARLIADPVSNKMIPALGKTPLEMQRPTDGGVLLEIVDSQNRMVKTEWYYENEEESNDPDHGVFIVDGMRARVHVTWDHWRSPAVHRYRMVSAPGLPLKIVKIGDRNSREVKVGEVVTLDNGLGFLVGKRADRPKVVPVIDQVQGDANNGLLFFDDSPPAARIEVDGPEGKKEFMIGAVAFADTAIYANRIAIRIFENESELPKEWKSKLDFLEKNPATGAWEIQNSQTIRVNDYAFYRGFRFFQTDANKQLPGYSGVGVVFDPGIETVIYGMWAIVAGVAYVFLLKPFIRKSVQK